MEVIERQDDPAPVSGAVGVEDGGGTELMEAVRAGGAGSRHGADGVPCTAVVPAVLQAHVVLPTRHLTTPNLQLHTNNCLNLSQYLS